MRCNRWERERDTERERERERESDAEVTSPFYRWNWRWVLHFSLPKICTLVSPLLNGAEFTDTFRCQKRSTLRTLPLLRFASVKWRDRGLKHQQTIEFLAAPTFLSSKKWIKLIPKTIGNRKRDCARGCAWGINTTWENLEIEKHKSVWWAERTPPWFVLFDLQIFSGGVYPPSATSRTIFFSISNSFWY